MSVYVTRSDFNLYFEVLSSFFFLVFSSGCGGLTACDGEYNIGVLIV